MKLDPGSVLINSGFALAALSGLGLALSGPGSRLEWWNFRFGFGILKWAMFGGLLGTALCAAGLFLSLRAGTRDGLALAGAGLLIGLVIAGIPLNARRTAKLVPVINDITTDTQDPPEFSAVLQSQFAELALQGPEEFSATLAANHRANSLLIQGLGLAASM